MKHQIIYAILVIVTFTISIIVLFLRSKLKASIKKNSADQISLYSKDSEIEILNEKLRLKEQEVESLNQNKIDYEKQVEFLEKNMALQFENLSNKIIETSIEKMEKNSTKSLTHLLDPLREKIGHFQHRIEHYYTEEAKERHSLKNEIKNISEIGNQLNKDAINLTNALKGDVKAQGNWGEMVLEKILENSGLRKGHEYITQGIGLNLKTDEGNLQKPDVLIMLPENKHVIVDSKVSLTHYERFITSTSEIEKVQNQKLFTESLEKHVKDLTKKDYAKLDKLDSPDFVLMFFPIEGAYSLAIQKNPELFYWAWDRSIIIVGPTTLMATLKTISSIWRQEKSNKNAQEIATESGKMYDKMASFLNDLLKVGDQLKRTEDTYQASIKKLKSGKGNVISRLEHIRNLGAKSKKQINLAHDELNKENQGKLV